MRPGMWTSYFIDLSPEEMVSVFSRKGWNELEISDEHACALVQRGEPYAVGEQFRRYAEDLGIRFPQGHLWLTCDIVAENTAPVLSELRRWLDLFMALGVKAGVLHPGGSTMLAQGAERSRVNEIRVDSLRQIATHVRGSDLVICLENLGTGTQTLEDLMAILTHAGEHALAICLDTGHLNIVGGDQAAFIRGAGPRLKALHIDDNEGHEDQHLMPYGRGTVPWSEVANALRQIGYTGLYNFEIPGENHCPMEVRLAKLDFLRTILPILL